MTAYAFAHLRRTDLNDDVARYLLRIDDTLSPYGGRFLVHGSVPEVVDGEFEGVLVVIEFPDLGRAHAWYSSAAYRAIVGFRLDNTVGGAGIVDGVSAGYTAASFLRGAAPQLWTRVGGPELLLRNGNWVVDNPGKG